MARMYFGEELPGRNWSWPKDTYLQRRLQRRLNAQPISNQQLKFELACRVPRCLLQHSSHGTSGATEPPSPQWQEAGLARVRPLIFTDQEQ